MEGKENTLIDASCPVMEPLSDKKVKKIILTHLHFDHIIFTKPIVDAHHCRVYATKEAESWMERYRDSLITEKYTKFRDSVLSTWLSPPSVEPFKITDFVKEGDVIYVGSLPFRVLETPGHFPGEICLYNEKKRILFPGDVWFGDERYGSPNFREENKEQLEASITRLKSLKVDKLYPGHLL